MNRGLTFLLAVAVLAACHSGGPPDPPDSHSLPASARLTDSAPSIDALIASFMDALAQNDLAALHRLRLTKDEYVSLIVPGTVAVGQPPRQISGHAAQIFWRLLDAKSRDTAYALVQGFGGHHYTIERLRYTKGVQRYAWYTAYGEVRLRLQNDEGVERELKTGWIAEVDGQYKFIGLSSNN